MKEKILKKYKLTDDDKQEEDALRYWASKSIKKKIDAMEQIIKNYVFKFSEDVEHFEKKYNKYWRCFCV